MKSEFIDFLKALPEPRRKNIRAAWRFSAASIEQRDPAMLGWTKRDRLAHLFTAGLFCEQPLETDVPFIVVVREAVSKTDLHRALGLQLVALEPYLRRWGRELKHSGFHHRILFADLKGWDHPKRLVQHRWASQLADKESHEN